MRYGIFGGAFDPPHAGHIAVAQAAHQGLDLDRILFIPSLAPPHRQRPLASFHHRLGMLRVALADLPWALVSGIELELSSPTYAYDMVKALKARQGAGPTPYLLIGADNYQGFTTWYRWRDLLTEVELAVYPRSEVLPQSLTEVPAHFLRAALRSEQSTALRKAMAAGDLSALQSSLPAVAGYIRQNDVYPLDGKGRHAAS